MKQVHFLSIQDLLDGGIEARGVRLDAHFTCEIRKIGGCMEIESSEMGNITVIVAGEYLLLDQEQFKAGHRLLYNAFIEACEKEAFRQALLIPDYKWRIEYDLDIA
jgi:hypothetical protein